MSKELKSTQTLFLRCMQNKTSQMLSIFLCMIEIPRPIQTSYSKLQKRLTRSSTRKMKNCLSTAPLVWVGPQPCWSHIFVFSKSILIGTSQMRFKSLSKISILIRSTQIWQLSKRCSKITKISSSKERWSVNSVNRNLKSRDKNGWKK